MMKEEPQALGINKRLVQVKEGRGNILTNAAH